MVGQLSLFFRCHNGWNGTYCNKCNRYPGCLHGTCEKPWECICEEGWGGLFCNQDLNYCTNHKPCQNGGTCFNTGQGEYTCSCAPGFKGTNCDTPFLDCHSKPCLNGGSCSMEMSSAGGSNYENNTSTSTTSVGGGGNGAAANGNNVRSNYKCTCPQGWRGKHCEINSKSCKDLPCRNGASCENDHLKGYVCHCPSGYSGQDCESQLNECSSNPCANNGTCADVVNGYRCTCPTGFTGERCEINIDDCQGEPCLNGGTCVDLVNKFHCQCVPGYTGMLCQEKVDYCLVKPCANGGKCISATNDYECKCKPGFTGKDCSVDIDECLSSPCRNGGLCRSRVNGFSCECIDNWIGATCSEKKGTTSHHHGNNHGGGGGGNSNNHDNQPSGASYWTGNLSRQFASAEARDIGLTTEHVVVIATLSTAVPAFVLVAALAVMCMKRRQKREQAKADEEARLQNERNAVHSSLSKRNGGVGVCMGVSASATSVCNMGDAHMIKNTWTANKSLNSSCRQDDMDSLFQTDTTMDSSCSGYKAEPVMQVTDGKQRTPNKQMMGDSSHRTSHLFQKEKECGGGLGLGIGISIGVGVLEAAKRSSMFSTTTSESCCSDALLKRPSAIAENGSCPGGGGGGGSTGGSIVGDSGCGGVYVIDEHYRHDPSTLAATLATEV